MKEFVGLNSSDLEHLFMTIEGSMGVENRAQFFLWSQGALQAFLPHETLLCAHGDIAQMRFRCEAFSGGVVDDQTAQGGNDPVDALMPRIVDDWLLGGSLPRSLSPEGGIQTGRRQLLGDLRRRNFGHALAHGVREIQGEQGGFFAFLRMPRRPTARENYLLELLMPHLHMAMLRMLASEKGDKSAKPAGRMPLSKREIQVLYWVKGGKTNQEIGQILGISPPTAKNHVQQILRKLKVSNRAEAVGKGVALRLFSAAESA